VPRSGENCEIEGCGGVLKTYKTSVMPALKKRVRSLECNVCGHRPEKNKMVIPLEYAPIQQLRPTSRNTAKRLVQKRIRF